MCIYIHIYMAPAGGPLRNRPLRKYAIMNRARNGARNRAIHITEVK